MPTHADHFPTDVSDLARSKRAETLDVRDGESVDLRIAPVAKQIGDTTVRMLAYNGSIPGPTLRVAEGSEIVVNVENQGDSRRPSTGTGYASTTATTERTRRSGRWRSARASSTGSRSPIPALYWYHPHIRQDYGQELGPLRQHPRRPARPGLLAAGPPRSRAHARRHPDRGRPGRALQPGRDDVLGDGPLRQRDARQGEPDLALDAQRGRGRPLLPHQHRQHARLQRRRPRRPDEARRRRQRPLRARGVRRLGRARAVGARRRRRPLRRRRRGGARTPDAGAHLRARVDRGRSTARSTRSRRGCSTRCARTRSWSPSASGSRHTATPSRTRRSRSSPRWTSRHRRATVVYSVPDAPGGREHRGRASARSAA